MTSICIFGSVARKDQDSLSDKDALILYDGSPECRSLMTHWRETGWSIASFTPKRLSKMADVGSLFIQHLKQEGLIVQDRDSVLGDLLSSYNPLPNYSDQIGESASALQLLEHVPISHELDYWSADLLHVLIRNIGLLRLANEGIYEFSFSLIANKLIELSILDTNDIVTFKGLRAAKAAYRSGLLPNIPVNKTVESGLKIIDRLCGVSLQRTHSLNFKMPNLDQSYFNLRAIEKILVAYNGLPTPNRTDISIGEQEIWKRVKDPRSYSWDVKTKQSKLWQLLIDSVNPPNKKILKPVVNIHSHCSLVRI